MAKFCTKCGAQLVDGAKFCTTCGQVVEQALTEAFPEQVPAEAEQATVNYTPVEEGNAENMQADGVQSQATQPVPPVSAPVPPYMPPKAPRKKLGKGAIIGIVSGAVALVAALVIILVVSANAKNINLNEYTSVEFSGYEGYGRAKVVFDAEKFVKDNAKKFRSKEYATGELAASSFAMGAEYYADLDKSSQLKNGDPIKLTWDISAEEVKAIQQVYGVRMKFSEKELKVEGLEAVGSFDPFENLTVSYEGKDGFGSLITEKADNEFYYELYFSADKSYELKNGDTITITCDMADDAYFAENFGKIPSARTKTYTVSGLEEIGTFDAFASLEITYEGIDGFGYAYTKQADDDYYWSMGFNIDKNSDLKNGDTITATVDIYNEDSFAQNFGVLPEATTKTYTVEGLTEVQEIDPFEYLEIKYEGQNGSGYASFTVKEGAPEGVNTLSWDYTPESDLKNGDTIEVTVSYWSESEEDTNNDLARNYAIRLTKFKQTYTVEGLEKSDEEKAAEESEESEESSESEESQESEESAESEESSESEESQDPAAAADIIGTYKLDSFMGLDIETAQQFYDAGSEGGDLLEMFILEIKEDGKATFTVEGQAYDMEWTLDGNKLTLTVNGESLESTYEDGKISMTIEGIDMVMKKQ